MILNGSINKRVYRGAYPVPAIGLGFAGPPRGFWVCGSSCVIRWRTGENLVHARSTEGTGHGFLAWRARAGRELAARWLELEARRGGDRRTISLKLTTDFLKLRNSWRRGDVR
jgi:hypothetical protein